MATKTTTRARKSATVAAPAAPALTPEQVLAVLGALGIEVPAGTAQVKARESRAVDVVQNEGEKARTYGEATITKLTKGEWLPAAGIRAKDLRFVAGRLIEIADNVGA